MSHLSEHVPLANLVPSSWASVAPSTELLDRIEAQVYGDTLHQASASASASVPTILPPRDHIFRAMERAGSPEQVRVVILGQDPYIRPGQATGMAFGVPAGTWPLPPSLRNIIKRVTGVESSGIRDAVSSTFDVSLDMWAAQGVLLLNTALTVAEGRSNSHASVWKPYTQELLTNVVRHRQTRIDTPPLVFLLWGAHAIQMAERAQCFEEGCRHHVIACSHPSPLSCTRPVREYPAFMPPAKTQSCFEACNDALVRMGSEPVRWCSEEGNTEQGAME